MNDFDLYKRVVDDCDEALREAFIKRMNIADKIAEFKLNNNQKITTSQIDEKHIQRVVFDVPVEVCLERNRQRTGRAVVPDHVIQKMAISFYPPNDPYTIYVDQNGVIFKSE